MKKHLTILILGILLCISCKIKKAIEDPIPHHQTINLSSKVLGETRVINVWVPEGYEKNTDSLPVIYMLDGGIKEDFPHVANTLNELIKAQKIPQTILVGVENTQRRKDLTGPTEIEEDKKIAKEIGGSEKFRLFIQEELFPQIQNNYRIKNEKTIIGESLAGLFVIETLLLQPNLFDKYIAFDPSLWWNNHYLVKTAKDKLTNTLAANKKLWFAGSNAQDIAQYTQQLNENIKDIPKTQLTYLYSDEPNEKHNTIFRATKEKALIWTLNN